ncbi:hypothetical protein C8Q79DRAFT_929967 [Trametes meyenii]|nr:hypothetical protein C8Q79DRAFT_929967 [Trametes meyenii]
MAHPTLCDLPLNIISQIYHLVIKKRDFETQNPRGVYSTSVAPMSTTCRVLSEPALNILWEELTTILPLLHTLPPDLCAFVTVTYGSPLAEEGYRSHVTFLRTPVSGDFVRFTTYSRRVKAVCPYNQDWTVAKRPHSLHYDIPTEVWNSLQRYGSSPLLPNLSFLDYDERNLRSGKTLSAPVELLFGPTLKNVKLNLVPSSYSTDRPATIVKALMSISPCVEEVAFDESSGLRSTSIFCPDVRGLSHLTSFGHSRTWTGQQSAPTQLSIHGIPMNSCLAQPFSPAAPYDPPHNGRAFRLDGRSLAHSIFQIAASVGGLCHVTVDDRVLEIWSRAWPNIVDIAMRDSKVYDPSIIHGSEAAPSEADAAPDEPVPRATLAGLVPLVRRCPRLHMLAFAINTDSVPDLESLELPPASIASSGLGEMFCAGAALGDPMEVAAFLSYIVPQLRDLTAEDDQWALEVGAFHSDFVAIRMQEREWARRHGKRFRDVAKPLVSTYEAS